MSKYIPVDPEKWAAMVIAQRDLVRYKEICDELDAECTRLKAEIERLTKHDDDTCPHLVVLGRLEAENARLNAEVQRLTAFTTRTIIPNEELQAQVERLTKAGDVLANNIVWVELYRPLVAKWNAAKEGKGQP